MIELNNGELRMSLSEVRKGEIFRTLDAVAGIGLWRIAKASPIFKPHHRRPNRKVWAVPSILAPL